MEPFSQQEVETLREAYALGMGPTEIEREGLLPGRSVSNMYLTAKELGILKAGLFLHTWRCKHDLPECEAGMKEYEERKKLKKKQGQDLCEKHHTKCPAGYVAWSAWAEQMSKTHAQIRCPGCGLFNVWLPIAEARKKNAADTAKRSKSRKWRR